MILWLPLPQPNVIKEYLFRFYVGFLVQGFPGVIRKRIQFQMHALYSLRYLIPHNWSCLHLMSRISTSMPHPLTNRHNFANWNTLHGCWFAGILILAHILTWFCKALKLQHIKGLSGPIIFISHVDSIPLITNSPYFIFGTYRFSFLNFNLSCYKIFLPILFHISKER